MSPKSHLILIFCFVSWICDASTASARPPHKKALADYFGPYLAKKLNDCQTCHLPDKPGADATAAGKPHNPFGAEWLEIGEAKKTLVAATEHRGTQY